MRLEPTRKQLASLQTAPSALRVVGLVICIACTTLSLACGGPVSSPRDVEQATITGLRTTLNAQEARLSGLSLELDNASSLVRLKIDKVDAEIAAIKQSAGGDINSTLALIAAILAPTICICFIAYMMAERFPLLKWLKNLFKGKQEG